MKKQIANMITGFRILCSIVLILLPVFSVQFYIVYLVCGLSDMADGAVARRTNSTSSFGSKLDTAADIIFVVAAMAKLLPRLHLPMWLWIWVAVIALILLGAGVIAARTMRRRKNGPDSLPPEAYL